MEANEEKAREALMAIGVAQFEIRSRDLDGNGLNDFWVRDVASLCSWVEELDDTIGAADGSGPNPVPYHGYLFRAVTVDENGNPYEPSEDGDGRNSSRWAFTAYPAKYGKTGKMTFALGEENTLYRRDTGGQPVLEFPNPDETGSEKPYVPRPLQRLSARDDELPRTHVSAVLEVEHEKGRNLLWCVTFALSWQALSRRVGEPVRLDGAPEWLPDLNRPPDGPSLLDPSWYVARAGLVREGVLEEIEKEMIKKFGCGFPGLPEDPTEDCLVACAFLQRTLKYAHPFERNPMDLQFRGTRVESFGLMTEARRSKRDQVRILGRSSDTEFIVELLVKPDTDRLLLARISPGRTLRETVERAVGFLESGKGAGRFTTHDTLLVPCLNFRVSRSYGELVGRALLNEPWHQKGYFVKEADQIIEMRLDETGALLRSAATTWATMNGDEGRNFVFDGPFLLMMMKRGAPGPYFALWIEDAEILARRP